METLNRRFSSPPLMEKGVATTHQVCQTVIKLTRAEVRLIREEHQRFCARRRYAATRRLIPKLTRKRAIDAERRSTAQERWLQAVDNREIFEQSGVVSAGLGALKGVGLLVGAFSALSMGRAAGKVAKSTDEIAGSVTSLLDTIRTRIDEFTSFVKSKVGIWWVIPLAVLLYAIYRQYGCAPLVGLAITALVAKVFGHMWPRFEKHFSTIQEQSEGELPALVATAACMCMFPKSKSPDVMADLLMRRAGGFQRSVDGFQSIFKYAMVYAEKIVNAFLRLFSKDEIHFTNQTERLMRSWMQEVDDFEKVCTLGNPTLDQLKSANGLQLDGIGFRQVLRVPSSIISCNKYLERLGVLLQAHRGALDASNSFRPQPSFVVLGGLSAVGKTSALKALGTMTLLLAGEVSAKEAMANLWQKGTTEYWNGYVGQKCLILDDCFQIKPQPGKEDNEYMQIIRAVGNWAYPLNFADIESKGRFYFNSPLMIGTTNAKNVDQLAGSVLNCPEAVVRRIQFGYWITVSPEWTNGGIFNYAKVEAEYARRMEALPDNPTQGQVIDAFPWEAWRVYPHDFRSEPMVNTTPLNMKDIMYAVATDMRNKKSTHSEGTELLMRWLQKAESAFPGDQSSSGEIQPQNGSSNTLGMRHLLAPLPIREQRELAAATDVEITHRDRFFPVNPQPVLRRIEDRQDRDRVEHDSESAGWWSSICDFALGAAENFMRWLKKPLPFDMKQIRRLKPRDIIPTICALFTESWDYIILRLACLSICFVLAREIMKFSCSMLGHFTGRRKKGRKGIKDQSNIKEGAEKKKQKNFVFKDIVSPQLGTPPRDDQQNKIYENSYKMTVGDLDDPECETVGQVQFVQGTVALMPAHFRQHLACYDGERELVFTHCLRKDFNIKIPIRTFLAFPGVRISDDVDAEFVRFDPATIRSHWNIVPYFLTKPNMASFLRVRNVQTRLDVATVIRHKNGASLSRVVHRPPAVEYRDGISVRGQSRTMVVEYQAQTVEGDCGAPLTIAESRTYNGCYIGFHIAGTTGWYQRYGYATYVTAEMALNAIKLLSAYTDKWEADAESRGIHVSPVSVEEQCGIVGDDKLVNGSFLLLGKVSQPLSMSTRTALRPTALYHDQVFGACPTAPAVLSPVPNEDGELVHPMVRGLQAYQSPLEYREVPLMDGIVRLATQRHREETLYAMREVFSAEEAVLGIPGLKIKKIARDTSAGYPYRLSHTAGKKAFFGDGEEYELTSDEWISLKARVDHVVESAKRGERLCHIFTDFLKDELRPLHKVRSVTTRVISGAPLDYVVAVRMYFGAFLAAMFSSHTESGMAPGVNHYTEWYRLATLLKTRGDKVFGGDFSRFDASEQPYIHMKILQYINDWYASFGEHIVEDDRVREILWMDLIHSRHLSGVGNTLQYLVQWNKSLPSGHPLTTPVNSLYSLITLTACYVHSTGDLTDMWSKACIITFGDDNVNAVSDAVAEAFNQVTVSQKMKALFNLDYTSDKKGEALIPYETLEEVTFLKRSFRRDEQIGSGGWVAPLALDSFLYVPYWTRNRRDEKGDIINNLQNSLGEMSLHPPEVWDKYYPILAEWARSVDFGILPFSRRAEARDWISTRTDVWF